MYQIKIEQPVRIHFIGIGGISMSAIAELLQRKGFTVTGSDERRSPVTEHLESLGIEVYYGNRASNIHGSEAVIVYTAAVHPDNLEFRAAEASGIPLLTRAELLGQLMLSYSDAVSVAGTHGKTTTTSMLSLVEMEAGFDPTVFVGGDLPDIKGNLRMGQSMHLVMEACEYTNSFLHFNPKHAIILNIEADHLDFFKDLDDIRHSFRLFAELVPAGGHLVINGEIPSCCEITDGLPCSVLTFGIADTPENCSRFDYAASGISFDELGRGSFDLYFHGEMLTRVTLSVNGIHNIANALAAFAMAHSLGADTVCCCRALSKYKGTKRRFELKGSLGEILVMDDYAHHPSEIKAALNSARAYGTHRIVCVFQPHTYSRTRSLLHEFADALTLADIIVLPDIYPAREEDPGDISSCDIKTLLEQKGKEVYYFPSFDEIESFLLEKCCPGDLLITMGAGDVVKIGEALLGK